MREIEFRGLTIRGKWAYGLFAISTKEMRGPVEGHYISNSVGSPFAYHVRPETVSQFTGIKDKNGKKIYEGDIVKHDGWNPSIMQICFDRGAFYLAAKDKHEVGDIKYAEGAEVIGNVHENAELLNKD